MTAYTVLTQNQITQLGLIKRELKDISVSGDNYQAYDAKDALDWLEMNFDQMNSEPYNQNILALNFESIGLDDGLDLLDEIAKQPVVIDNSENA